jgi:pSer/pThr/pTyr-binding forkhead associated (FHA) protein
MLDRQYLTLTPPSGTEKPFKELAEASYPIAVGRASKNDPAAQDPSSGKMRTEQTKVMSSEHASITWEDGNAFIEDLASTNGTTSRRQNDAPHKLKPGVKYIVSHSHTLSSEGN